MHQREPSDVRYALVANDAPTRASAAVEGKAAPIQEGPMDIGVVFPQVEIGPDPARIRDYAQAVEGMGYAHVLAFDHVLGANPERPGGWKGPYTHRHAFHEPFVLFGFLAGVTSRLGLATGILILPQRQTALVAKQAAAVDVLSGGRLRLGVGVGWNAVEFEALGENFKNRGKRIEEQIAVMRALWAEELVTVDAQWHRIPDAGINPLPPRRSIPIWMGGESEVVVQRAARLAEGWMPHFRPRPESQGIVDRLHQLVRDAGRDPGQFGIEGRMTLSQMPPAEWAAELGAWRAMRGITHLCVNTMGMGLATPEDHSRMLERFKKEAMG
jgi:probable F420-dependent oxidoreductase